MCVTLNLQLSKCVYVYMLSNIRVWFDGVTSLNSALLDVMLETLDSNGRITGISEMTMKVCVCPHCTCHVC